MHETLYRAMAMYLVAQFLKFKRGEEPDWELNDLVHIYDDIAKVNQAFGERLASIHCEDTSLTTLPCRSTRTTSLNSKSCFILTSKIARGMNNRSVNQKWFTDLLLGAPSKPQILPH